MIRFEKISFRQYREDRLPMLGGAGNVASEDDLRAEYDAISLPQRGTAFSAGYDLRTPYDFVLKPGDETVIPTGLKIRMPGEFWLGIYIRSSLGFKYSVRLLNSTAVIDADYADADNEGHIKVGIYNGGSKELSLHKGDAFAQGILQKYYLTDDDAPVKQRRTGGFGSTNS
ncbi:MAG: deoxyuridine 5'-triphosphate nucleotidohydrolase [Firmicutes bacterium]|nr:deoxyuridine 5'-triphosphate nucleotidohydrolase [Bacillota bacterium]